MNDKMTIDDQVKQKKDFIIYKMVALLIVICVTIIWERIVDEKFIYGLVLMEFISMLGMFFIDLSIYKFLKRVLIFLHNKKMLGSKIVYWNDYYLLLTSEYIFAMAGSKGFSCILYDDIESVQKEEYYTKVGHSPHLNLFININLRNGEEYSIDIEGSGDPRVKSNIIPMLLEKNPDIIVEDTVFTPWYKRRTK